MRRQKCEACGWGFFKLFEHGDQILIECEECGDTSKIHTRPRP